MYKIFKINELGIQTVKRLFSIKEQIDFFPSYQRFGNIWDLRKKRLLIDTIINKFDIPKFYFNYFIEINNDLNINDKLYAIIDGKQRLQAIFDFLDDKFSLDSDCVYLDNPTLKINNLRFSELLKTYPQIVPIIEDYILDIVFITTDEEDRLEELFLRLNGGVGLTNAEKRNAISSYLNVVIREMVEGEIFFNTKVKFNNPRYQHNDLLTKLLFIEFCGDFVNLGNRELEEFLRSNNNNNDELQDLIYRTKLILSLMENTFQDKDFLLKSKGLIPVYYEFIKNKNGLISLNEIREFFLQFENLKISNRKLEEPDPVLQEFDRLNQQGVHREKSLKKRYQILDEYFHEFIENGGLTNTIEIKDVDLDDSDNFDEF